MQPTQERYERLVGALNRSQIASSANLLKTLSNDEMRDFIGASPVFKGDEVILSCPFKFIDGNAKFYLEVPAGSVKPLSCDIDLTQSRATFQFPYADSIRDQWKIAVRRRIHFVIQYDRAKLVAEFSAAPETAWPLSLVTNSDSTLILTALDFNGIRLVPDGDEWKAVE